MNIHFFKYWCSLFQKLKNQFLEKRLFSNTLAWHFLLPKTQSWLNKASVACAAFFPNTWQLAARSEAAGPGCFKDNKTKTKGIESTQAHFSRYITCTHVCAYKLTSIFLFSIGIEARAFFFTELHPQHFLFFFISRQDLTIPLSCTRWSWTCNPPASSSCSTGITDVFDPAQVYFNNTELLAKLFMF